MAAGRAPPGHPGLGAVGRVLVAGPGAGEWRAHDVLRRHPTLLARLAAGETAASLDATRDGWRTLRRDVGRGGAQLPPDVVDEAMAAYETQGVRLVELQRQIDAVRQAIDGFGWVPGAGRWARTS